MPKEKPSIVDFRINTKSGEVTRKIDIQTLRNKEKEIEKLLVTNTKEMVGKPNTTTKRQLIVMEQPTKTPLFAYKNKWYDKETIEKTIDQCSKCKKIIPKGMAKIAKGIGTSYFCDKCYEQLDQKFDIFKYHGYEKVIKWKETKDELKMGIEWEIINKRRISQKQKIKDAKEIIKEMGFNAEKDDEIIVSEDSSLGPNGFEIITQPETHKEHRTKINWIKAMRKAEQLGYMSHDGGKCGIHIHVNRNYFKNKDYEDKIMMIIMNNKDWIKKFSRRKNWYYCPFPIIQDEKNIKKKITAIKEQSRTHRSAVNLKNKNTIEFRFTRGTTIPETLFAAMELIEIICNAAKNMSIENCAKLKLATFKDIAEKENNKPFINYMKRMQIL